MAPIEDRCTGKRKHTYLAAHAVIRKLKRQRSNKPLTQHLHAYRCSYCKHWHIGSAQSTSKRKRPRHDERLDDLYDSEHA